MRRTQPQRNSPKELTGNTDHDRHDHHGRPHHHAARAVARHAVAQGPCVRRRAQLPGGRGRDQGRHRRHGLPVLVPAGTEDDHRRAGGDDHPARDRQGRHRGRRHLERHLQDHRHLRPRRHRHHGDVGARHRAVGRDRQAGQHAAAPAVGPRALANSGLRLRLLPRLRRRRHDRQGAALQGARLQGDQDADGAQPHDCARTSTT